MNAAIVIKKKVVVLKNKMKILRFILEGILEWFCPEKD
jgi:hypothetical protein